MNLFFCDASALAKRYAAEMGTSVMNHLLDTVSHDRIVMLTQSLGETLSVLVRRLNAGVFSPLAYRHASQTFRDELITAGQVQHRATEDALVFVSLPLIERYSVNSTDALVLRAALDLAATLQALGDAVVLVASDTRLLSTAQAEGLTTFNPETGNNAQLDALIAAP